MTLLVDDKPMVVVWEKRSSHGYIEVGYGPDGVAWSAVTLPGWWVESKSPGLRAMTSGSWYEWKARA